MFTIELRQQYSSCTCAVSSCSVPV